MVDHLKEVYGEDFRVGTIGMVIDVITEAKDGIINPIICSCSDSRRWIQEALFAEALDMARDANEDRHREATGQDAEDD